MSVEHRTDGQVVTITIDRPERRNALDHGMLEELSERIARAATDEPRAVVLRGAHGHFCAGADLTQLEDQAFTRTLRTMLDALAALPMPTIADISGSCMGLGMQLALACDLRVATEDAKFAVPVARLGLMVDHWTVRRLAHLAGASTARWMLLTARVVDAPRAFQVGLIQEIVDDGGAQELADGIARLAPLALRGSKLGLDLIESHLDPSELERIYGAAFDSAWASDDLVEGRNAFADRRAPEFKGR